VNVTDQQSELDRWTSQPSRDAADSRPSGASAEAIAAGLKFVFAQRREAAWSLGSSLSPESTAWVTAYVLARLGEIPSHHLCFTQRQKIEQSLDWLAQERTPQGGWSFAGHGSPDDADTTAWAVTALRQHGRPVQQGALQLIHRCRRPDGGYTTRPEALENITRSSAADVTAIAVRALCAIDAASSEFLAAHLQTNAEAGHGRVRSALFVSSTLMDWEPCMAPWFVVNAVRQLVQQEAEGTWEQALLLRRLQRANGSWPGSACLASLCASSNESAVRPSEYFDEDGVLATVTALSALAIGDQQPGLYFGSDLPFRRL
jgi:hypothetical protein